MNLSARVQLPINLHEARDTAYQAEATHDASMLGIAKQGSLQL